MTALLRVKQLGVCFEQNDQKVQAVKDVSFSIEAGETLALVGESGSGKSVTAHAILGLLDAKTCRFNPGSEVVFQDQDLLRLSEPDMRRIRGNQIGMVFQEPMTALNPLHNVEKQIGEVLLIHQGYSHHQARRRVLELLTLVGLPDPEKRLTALPHELSGGQRQRVMIAMALANNPALLIADEPTTALDVTLQKQVLDLLRDIQRRLGLALLLISHDLGIVRHYSDRVLVMQHGEACECQSTDDLFRSPQHPYTKALLDAEPSGEPQPLPPTQTSTLDVRSLRVWFPLRRGVFKRVTGYVKAVDGISFSLQAGETLGIVGESGSGKSTLVMALLRLIASQGEIHFCGHRVDDLSQSGVRPLRRQMQMVFQDPFASLSPRMTVQDIIAEGLVIHQLGSPLEREQRVITAMCEVGLDPQSRHRYPHEFSGGQRQRIAIARALVMEPKLIVLDEPTSALDRAIQCQVIDLLRELQARYQFSYIFISHDLSVVRVLAHRILIMQNGKLVEEGPTQRIFQAPQQPYTRLLLDATLGVC